MNASVVAVLDNTVLRNLYELKLLPYLNLYYSKVYVPVEVEKEFLRIKDLARQQQRLAFLFQQNEEQRSWFEKCNFYSDEQVAIVAADMPPNIHRGELEAAVQRGVLAYDQPPILLFDERRFRTHCINQAWPVRGTLSLLADLHPRFGPCDFYACAQCLVEAQGQRYSPKLAEAVFEQTRKELAGY